MCDTRDEKLWSLLPAIDDPYDYHSLSRAETREYLIRFGRCLRRHVGRLLALEDVA
jgi:hypothetical protein